MRQKSILCKTENFATCPKKAEHFGLVLKLKLEFELPNCLGETVECESSLRRHQLVRNEDLREDLQGNSEKSQSKDETKDDKEARNDFWSIEEDFIYRYHVEPRIQLYVPKGEETLPIPLKYVYVIRTTHTNLNVLQESRIDDYWNVDVDRSLLDSWTGFTKVTILNEKPLKGYLWSGGRLAKIHATTRPDYLWPEIWSGMSEAAQNRKTEVRQ